MKETEIEVKGQQKPASLEIFLLWCPVLGIFPASSSSVLVSDVTSMAAHL